MRRTAVYLTWLITALPCVLQAQNVYPNQPSVLEAGKKLFEEHCSSCHNFSQKSIGPALHRATSELPKEWLKKFIHNAPQMIESGEDRSVKIFEEYQQIMPPFTFLQDEQIDEILAFIHQNQKEHLVSETNGDFLPDPIPEKIQPAEGTLLLSYHSTAPATGTQAPLARINKMQVLKEKKERLFIVDLQGILYEISDTTWQVALDIRALRPSFVTRPGLGTGFGSFAFHPDFKRNRLLYTTHAEKVTDTPGDLRLPDSVKVGLQWVLTEWQIEKPSMLPFKGKAREVLRIDLLTTSHGVQEITFNPTARKGDEDYGLLYIGIGDGGSAEKKGYYTLCSDNTVAQGAVLRINPLGNNSSNGQYGIPKGNPYSGATDPKVKKEIFCRGLRNPNRIIWTSDGRMLINDIGQSHIEEVNLGTAGADYGWPEREGTFRVNPRGDINRVYPLNNNESEGHYSYPILQYDHDEGKAISGGFIYQGKAARALRGKYIFSDITNGRVFMAESSLLKSGSGATPQELKIQVDGESVTFQQLVGPAKPDVRLGQGPGKELFFFSKANGKLYKVTGYSPSK